MERLRGPVAHDVDFDFRTGPAAQVPGHLRAGHSDGRKRVDAHDAVVGPDADPFGRASGDGVDDDHRVAQHVELHADAAEFAVEALLDALHLFGIEVGRVGVQLFEHPPDGALDDGFHLHLVDIETVQIAVDLHQFAELLQVFQFLGFCRGRSGQERSDGYEIFPHGILCWLS